MPTSPSVLPLSCMGCCNVMYTCRIFPWKISSRNHTLLSAVFCDEKSPSSKNHQDQNPYHLKSIWKLCFHIANCMVGNKGQRLRNLACAEHQHQPCMPWNPASASVWRFRKDQQSLTLVPSTTSRLWAHSGCPVESRTYQSEPVLLSGWLLGFWLRARGPWLPQSMAKARPCLQRIKVP